MPTLEELTGTARPAPDANTADTQEKVGALTEKAAQDGNGAGAETGADEARKGKDPTIAHGLDEANQGVQEVDLFGQAANSKPFGPDLSDELTGAKSLASDNPLHRPAHNANGHRNIVVNQLGQQTVLDDDTARVLFENPAFYSQIYDNGIKDSNSVKNLRWANVEGVAVSAEEVGKPYALGD
jgi:hypothetical protein